VWQSSSGPPHVAWHYIQPGRPLFAVKAMYLDKCEQDPPMHDEELRRNVHDAQLNVHRNAKPKLVIHRLG
jgi:hypothetical protein